MKEIFTFIILLLGVDSLVQTSVRTGYISNSELYDAVADTNVGNGSAMIYSASAVVPLLIQTSAEDSPYRRVTIWGVALSDALVETDNHNFPMGKKLSSQVISLGVAVLHLRSLKERWSMLMALDIGSYTPENRLSAIRIGKNVLANRALVFIWHWRPNLEIGGGVILNNSSDYPMIFSALYLRYKGGFSGRFTIDIDLLNDTKVALGYDYNENPSLKLVANIGGCSAYLRYNGQKEVLSSQASFVGSEPEFRLGKHINIPVAFGGSFIRLRRYGECTLNVIFTSEAKSEDDSARSSVFLPALCFAAGATIK